MKLTKTTHPQQPTEQLLSYHLHKHAHGSRKGRPLTRIHASDITKEDWCPRRHALQVQHNQAPKDEELFTAQALAFECSSSIARVVVRWATGAGIAVGDWSCLFCGTVYVHQLRPKTCPECEGNSFWYHERRFKSEVSGTSGGVDLLVRLPGLEKDRMVELKALTKDAFKDLKMPLAEHRQRTNLYMRLAEESEDEFKDQVDTQQAILLYVTKGGYGIRSNAAKSWGLTHDAAWTPFKEFPVYRDDAATNEICEAPRALYNYLQGQGPMPPGPCGSPFHSLAALCPVRQHCFGPGNTK